MTDNLNKLSILDPTLASDIKKWTNELNDTVEVHRHNQVTILGDDETTGDLLLELRDNFILLHGYLITKKFTLSEDEIKSIMKSIFRSFNLIRGSIKDLENEHYQVRQINRCLRYVLYGDK